MINEVKIIDNFMGQEYVNSLMNMFSSTEFPWFYNDSITQKDQIKEDYILDNYYFAHGFYSHNNINSNFFSLVSPIAEKLNVFSLIRIQANLYTRTQETVFHDWHIDSFNQKELNWKTAVYYVNDNDGKTIIKENGLEKEINSVSDRIVIFPVNTLHRSTTATKSKQRIVINFNYY